MTLQRFLIGAAECRWNWPLRLARFRPRPAAPMGVASFAAWVIHTMVWAALGGFVIMGVASTTPMKGAWWPMGFALGVGWIAGVFGGVLVVLAWNRRAAQLARAGLTEPPAPPARRWWQTLIIAPIYALIFFLFTPLALWFAVDNALGSWEWRRTKASMEARGEPVTFAQLIPKRPADEQNFAMTPLLRPILDYEFVPTNGRTEILWRDPAGARRVDAIGLPESVSRSRREAGSSTNDARLDLDAYARGIHVWPVRKVNFDLPPEWAARYGVGRTNRAAMTEEEARALEIRDPAAEVLAYLRRFDAELQEITEASRRPYSQFPIRAGEGIAVLLPQLVHAKRFSTLFRVRSAARLQAGDPAGAFADAMTGLRLAEKASNDPLLISLLVRIAQSAIATDAVREGLIARQWTDAQIGELQAALAAMDFQAAGIWAFLGERAFANSLFDQWLSQPEDLAAALPLEDPSGVFQLSAGGSPFPRHFSPRGILRRNQILSNRLSEMLVARLRRPEWAAECTRAPGDQAFARSAGLQPVTPYNVLVAMLYPAVSKAEGKLARAQTLSRQAVVACALERHRLKHGTYPESLTELAPAFLKEVPADPMSGKPFPYRRLDDGWFRLWSVGLNGRDDGGVTKERDNDSTGDWVWAVPGLPPRAK